MSTAALTWKNKNKFKDILWGLLWKCRHNLRCLSAAVRSKDSTSVKPAVTELRHWGWITVHWAIRGPQVQITSTEISISVSSRVHSLCCPRVDEICFPVPTLWREKKGWLWKLYLCCTLNSFTAAPWWLYKNTLWQTKCCSVNLIPDNQSYKCNIAIKQPCWWRH